MAETQDISFGLKSCRQYTTDFYLAYHKTQYRRICTIADRISLEDVEMKLIFDTCDTSVLNMQLIALSAI